MSYANYRSKCFSQLNCVTADIACPRHDIIPAGKLLRAAVNTVNKGQPQCHTNAALPTQDHQHPAGATSTNQGKAWGPRAAHRRTSGGRAARRRRRNDRDRAHDDERRQKNNRSDSPGVAAAYAAAFASSPPLTVATYDDCAQLLAARESSGPCPARGGADNAPRRIKEVRGGRCRSRDGWLRGGPVFATAEDAGAEDTPTSEDFSGTNVQEEGVDEADTVKTSGDFIYKVGEIRGGEREADGSLEDCAYRLSVVEDTADGLQLVASVDLEPLATTPEAMFVHGDVLLLYGSAEVTTTTPMQRATTTTTVIKASPRRSC